MRAAGPVVVFLMLALLALPGCGGTPSAAHEAITPQRLSLTLFARTTDRRMTYFDLAANGDLRFGGGQQAVGRGTTLTRTLDAAQMEEIWRVIDRHGLLHGQSAGLFEKPEKVEYEVKISSRRGSASYRSLDDATPGLDELHELLFDLHAEVAYRLDRVRQMTPGPAVGDEP